MAMVNPYSIIITVVFFLLFLISYNWEYINLHFKYTRCPETTTLCKEDQTVTRTRPSKETILLVWNWPWGDRFPLDKCETEFGITGCKLSSDRGLYSVADAVLIHHADVMGNKTSLPQQPRHHHQRWVWVNMEPPLIISNLGMLNSMFNLTMTFRHDSDIYTPYGHIELLEKPEKVNIPKKSKLVSWVVSKWYPGVRRISYYEELNKHISVDIYGAGHMKLNAEDFIPTISKYKFYLAFENSIYPDYITEKLWVNALDSWTVPIVLGTSRENYERFLPGDAFIHVDDFPTSKELAAYLLELDKNYTKYMKYLNWRSHYRVIRWKGWSYSYCKACEKIQQGPRYQVIHNIEKWFLKM